MLTTLHPSEEKALSLSVRQQQILELLAQGKSNKEIASELHIEYGTVKQHLFVLFRKLNVTSRAKAALIAANLLKGSPLVFKAITAPSKPLAQGKRYTAGLSSDRYVWRLVCAVSVMIDDSAADKSKNILDRNHFLGELRIFAADLVEALDGQIVTLPNGGILAWFGHPIAHLDDADRASAFAEHLQQWIKARKDNRVAFSIGLAAHPEVVGEDAGSLYAAESFRMADILARNAKGLTWPLANALMRQLAPMSVPWLDLKTKDNNQAVTLEGVGPIFAIGPHAPSAPTAPTAAHRWGELPFMANIFEVVDTSVAQWLSIESWPAASATSLIDALGSLAVGKGFQSLRLRTPSNQRRDRQLASYMAQIELVFNTLDPAIKAVNQVHRTQYATGGERLVAMLTTMADLTPLLIQVYGLKALDAFEKVIATNGIERLASRRVLVIAANVRDAGVVQTSIRLLGPRPNAAPFSRVFTLQAPDLESLPEGIRVDLQTMLDDMSAIARDLILSAADHADMPISQVIQSFDLPQHQLQSAIQELTALGLVVPKQAGGFEFKDALTAQAIAKLNTPVERLV
jgi:DNA-binding CsgD family transcriptional regulator